MPRRASPVRLCKSVSRSGRSMPASSRADRGQAVRRRLLPERARGRPPPARLRDHERDHGRQHPGRARRQPVRGQGQARQVERGAGPDRALDRREPLPGDRQPRRGARDARAQGGRRGGVPTEPEAVGKPPRSPVSAGGRRAPACRSRCSRRSRPIVVPLCEWTTGRRSGLRSERLDIDRRRGDMADSGAGLPSPGCPGAGDEAAGRAEAASEGAHLGEDVVLEPEPERLGHGALALGVDGDGDRHSRS